MADTKITSLLTPQVTTNPATDVLPIVNIADTLMASSGSTRKITVNSLLGAGGTATLASATISGDLTVATNRLSVSSTGVQIGTTTNKTTAFTGNGTGLTIGAALAPTIALWDTTNASYVGSISQIDADMYLTNTGAGQMVFSTDNTSRYTISSTGISTWSVAGTTAMTLNSTGLGVGVTPAAGDGSGVFKAAGTGVGTANTRMGLDTRETTSGNAAGIWIGAMNSENTGVIGSRTASGNIAFQTFNGSAWGERMRIDYLGNVGIGVTPVSRLTVSGGVSLTSAASNHFLRDGTAWIWSSDGASTGTARGGLYADGSSNLNLYGGSTLASHLQINSSGDVISKVNTSVPTVANSQMVFNLTTNTNLRITVRGTDGTLRSANITLAP